MIFKVGGADKAIPSGEYLATVQEIKEKVFYKRKGLEFVFEVAEGPHRGTRMLGFVNVQYEVFSPHSKLYQWACAATGEALETGQEIFLEQFKSKVLRVRAEEKVSKKTKNKFTNVVEILGLHLDLD